MVADAAFNDKKDGFTVPSGGPLLRELEYSNYIQCII